MDFLTFQLIVTFLLLFSVSLLPIIFIGMIIRRKWGEKLKYALIIPLCIIQVCVFYSAFNALYPKDSFYMEEYKTVIGSPAPPSANVVKKSASYPDLHGDYYSVCIMGLSENDHKKLYKKIACDKSFQDTNLNSTEIDDFLNKEQRKNIIMAKQHNINDEGKACFVAFFNDRKKVLIYFIKL